MKYIKKLKIKSIITFLAIFLFAACEPDDSTTKDLQAQLTKLEVTITTLQGTINTLNSSNSTLSTELKTAQDAVDTATASLATAGTNIGDLQKQLETLNDELHKQKKLFMVSGILEVLLLLNHQQEMAVLFSILSLQKPNTLCQS
jgi:septal ring factor EnvC (AmiA/AmiB activator)